MRKILSKKDIKTLGLSSLGGTLNFMILLSLHSFQVIFQKTSSLKI